jgi:hypothetical protein
MKTLRTLPLASELPSDDQGRVYLAIDQRFCEFDLPSQLLPELLASGAIEHQANRRQGPALHPLY